MDILQKVPNTPYPEGSVTLGGPGIIIWACILITCLSFGSVAVSFVLTHSAIIINKSSTSKQTKSQHRSAIYSLIIQVSLPFIKIQMCSFSDGGLFFLQFTSSLSLRISIVTRKREQQLGLP